MSAALALLLLAQAAAPAPSLGATWRPVNAGETSATSVDPASIRREGDIVRLRWRIDYAQASPDGMRILVIHATVDCRARTFLTRRLEGYRIDGTPANSSDIPANHPAAQPQPFELDDPIARGLYRGSCERTAS